MIASTLYYAFNASLKIPLIAGNAANYTHARCESANAKTGERAGKITGKSDVSLKPGFPWRRRHCTRRQISSLSLSLGVYDLRVSSTFVRCEEEARTIVDVGSRKALMCNHLNLFIGASLRISHSRRFVSPCPFILLDTTIREFPYYVSRGTSENN